MQKKKIKQKQSCFQMNRGQLIGFWLGVGEGMGSTGTHVCAALGQMGDLLSREQSCRTAIWSSTPDFLSSNAK